MILTIVASLIIYILSQVVSTNTFCFIPRRKISIFYNFLSVFTFYSLLNVFFWNYEINLLITMTFFYILSLIMYYIHEFRGTNVNFSDILSIGTAKEVAAGYRYRIKISFIIILAIVVLTYVYVINLDLDIYRNYYMPLNGVFNHNIFMYQLFLHEIRQIFIFLFSFFLLRDIVSESKYDYSLMAGENEGYIYNFFSSIPIFHKSANGDEYDKLKSIENGEYKITINDKGTINEQIDNGQDLESTNIHQKMCIINDNKMNTNDLPHVIVIMNESFGSIQNYLKTENEITKNYDVLKTAVKGNLYVNTFGGGTANTEFEFLTGMTIGNYPYPVMPYNNFVKKSKYSLAKYFDSIGYKTIAMHPYTATNYNRDKVYKHFGFSELLFIDDFNHKKYVRSYISDECMYEEIIDRYVDIKNKNEKLFLFGITMQNHSGYQKFSDDKTIFKGNASYDDIFNNSEELQSYLNLMKISDEALPSLINYFDNEKEHVIILFFGDHNASFGTDINKRVFDTKENYELSNAYITPFFIYDNKKKEDGFFIDGISANFLSIELLKCAKLPFDDFHILLDSVYKNYDVYNYHKKRNRNTKEIEYITFDDYAKVEYEYLK